MTPEQIELAQRLTEHHAFQWMPGMLAWRDDCPPVRVTHIEDAGNALQEHRWRPDLSDPATVGCLLVLAREVYNDRGVFVRPRGSKMRPDWVVMLGETSDVVCAAPTEGEALALAILGAP